MDANGVSVRNNTNNRKSLSFLFVYVLVLAYQALNDDTGQRNIRGNDDLETRTSSSSSSTKKASSSPTCPTSCTRSSKVKTRTCFARTRASGGACTGVLSCTFCSWCFWCFKRRKNRRERGCLRFGIQV